MQRSPPMKFIHAADIHLDSPLAGLASHPDAPVEMLRTATREAFEALVTEAISEKVDFMIIAGDLYDGEWRDFHTGIFFARQMGRLGAAGIKCYVLFGNHDAESEMSKQLQLPPNAYRFPADKPGSFEIPELQVVLHGQSFKKAATTDNLAAGYPAPKGGWLNIGVLHTALEGHTEHATYAPCTKNELAARGYQYWALGHVHERWIEKVGSTTIAFPGNLQGRHIKETGPRGALMVEADGLEIIRVEPLHTDVLRWHCLEVDLKNVDTMADAVTLCGELLRELPGKLGWNCPVAIRVNLVGKSKAHGELCAAGEKLRAEMMGQAAAASVDMLWIEKVKVLTEPALSATELAARGDAVAELQKAIDLALADPDLIKAVDAELRELIAKLESSVCDAVDDIALVRGGKVAEILQRVKPAVLAQINSVE